MRCYSLMIGARNRPGRRRFSPAADATLQQVTGRHFPGGFTIIHAAGGWFDPDRRKFVREESRQVLVAAARPARLRAWCAELAAALRQEELIVWELGRLRRFRRPGPKDPRT